MGWEVVFTARARKQMESLPEEVRELFKALALQIRSTGPARSDWPNYGRIRGKSDCHHCHLKKGRPTYVAVWKVLDKSIRIVEVRYVGTHQGAGYRRIC